MFYSGWATKLPSSAKDICDSANRSWARILRRLEMTCVGAGDNISTNESESDVFVRAALSPSTPPSPLEVDEVSGLMETNDPERSACAFGRGGGRECVRRGGRVFVGVCGSWWVSCSVTGGGASSVVDDSGSKDGLGVSRSERARCGFRVSQR